MAYISNIALAIPTEVADALVAKAKADGCEDVLDVLARGTRRDGVKCDADVSWSVLRYTAEAFYDDEAVVYIRKFLMDDADSEYDYVRVGESADDVYEELCSGMDLVYARIEIVDITE